MAHGTVWSFAPEMISRGPPASGGDLGWQRAEGVSNDGRLLRQPADHAGEVVGHLADRLAREDLRVRVRLLHGLGIVGPAGRQGRVAGLLEERGPAIPA